MQSLHCKLLRSLICMVRITTIHCTTFGKRVRFLFNVYNALNLEREKKGCNERIPLFNDKNHHSRTDATLPFIFPGCFFLSVAKTIAPITTFTITHLFENDKWKNVICREMSRVPWMCVVCLEYVSVVYERVRACACVRPAVLCIVCIKINSQQRTMAMFSTQSTNIKVICVEYEQRRFSSVSS